MEDQVYAVSGQVGRGRPWPPGWESRRITVVVPIDVVRGMFRRAQQWRTDEGGRFDLRTNAVLLWSQADCAPPSRLVGSFGVRWCAPAPGLATIDELAWNPIVGGSVEEICRAMEILAGRM